MSSTGISVLICSHNGASRIAETIRHVALQHTMPGTSWEVVIVDNASTDQTANVATQAWAALAADVPFRVIAEPTPGKDKAIDTGITHSAYAYILICDDDNWLSDDYVQTAFEIMQSYPQIGALGGQGFPVTETELPVWFHQFQNYYAVGKQNDVSGEVTTSKGFLWGAGMVINARALHTLYAAGFRRIITYERFPQVARGEDIELCLAIRLTGHKIWYDERLKFQHSISSNKLNWAYVMRLVKEGAYMGLILGAYRNNDYFGSGWISAFSKRLRAGKDIKNSVHLLLARSQEGSKNYSRRLYSFHYLLSFLRLNWQYDQIQQQVQRLRASIRTGVSPTVSDYW